MTSCDNRHLHQDVDIVDDPGVDHHDSNENQYLFVFHYSYTIQTKGNALSILLEAHIVK